MYFMSVYLYRLTVLLNNILKFSTHIRLTMRYAIRVQLLSIIFKIQNNTADDDRSSSVQLNITNIVFVYLQTT